MSKQYEPVLPIEEATDICNAIDKVSLLFAGENSVQKLLKQKFLALKTNVNYTFTTFWVGAEKNSDPIRKN